MRSQLLLLSLTVGFCLSNTVDFPLQRPTKRVFDLSLEENLQSLLYFDDELDKAAGNAFTLSLYVGSSYQEFQLMVDTFSNQIMIPTVECENCIFDRYNISESTTGVQLDSEQSLFMQPALILNFFLQNYTTEYFYDNICFENNSEYCMYASMFQGIISVNPNIRDGDGILGLGLTQEGNLNNPFFGSSLLANLVEDNFISQKVFALYIDYYSDPDESSIRFGGFNPECVLFDINYRINGDYIQWYDLLRNDSWTLQNYELFLGDTNLLGSTMLEAQINPSSLLIALPNEIFLDFAELWLEGKDTSTYMCTSSYCFQTLACVEASEEYDEETTNSNTTLKILLGSNSSTTDPLYFELTEMDYMVPGGMLGLNEDYCFVGVSGSLPNSSNQIVLGDVFLYNFYTIFDQDNQLIGLSKSVNGYGMIKKSNETAEWAIPFVVIIVIVVLMITALFVICRTKAKAKKKKAELYYQSINEHIKKRKETENKTPTFAIQ